MQTASRSCSNSGGNPGAGPSAGLELGASPAATHGAEAGADIGFTEVKYGLCNASVIACDEHVKEYTGCAPEDIPNCWNCVCPLTEDGYFPNLQWDKDDPANAVLHQAVARLKILQPLPLVTYGIPVQRTFDSVIICRGSTCCIGCLKRKVEDDHAYNVSEQDALITDLALAAGIPLEEIETCPPRETLQMFGGIYSYEKYRRISKTHVAAALSTELLQRRPTVVQEGEKPNSRTKTVKSKYRGFLIGGTGAEPVEVSDMAGEHLPRAGISTTEYTYSTNMEELEKRREQTTAVVASRSTVSRSSAPRGASAQTVATPVEHEETQLSTSAGVGVKANAAARASIAAAIVATVQTSGAPQGVVEGDARTRDSGHAKHTHALATKICSHRDIGDNNYNDEATDELNENTNAQAPCNGEGKGEGAGEGAGEGEGEGAGAGDGDGDGEGEGEGEGEDADGDKRAEGQSGKAGDGGDGGDKGDKGDKGTSGEDGKNNTSESDANEKGGKVHNMENTDAVIIAPVTSVARRHEQGQVKIAKSSAKKSSGKKQKTNKHKKKNASDKTETSPQTNSASLRNFFK